LPRKHIIAYQSKTTGFTKHMLRGCSHLGIIFACNLDRKYAIISD